MPIARTRSPLAIISVWLLAVSLLLGLLMAFSACSGPDAASASSSQGANHVSASPSASRWPLATSGFQAALYVPGTWANRVVHWRSVDYTYVAGSIDPGNGHMLNADMWEKIGSDGRPELFHATYTDAHDGSRYQDLYVTRTAVVVVLGAPYRASATRDARGALVRNWCLVQSPSTFDGIAARAPLFVDPARFPRGAVTEQNGAPSQIQPETPAYAGVTPLRQFPKAASIHTWREVHGGHQVESDPVSGRLIVAQLTVTDAQGGVQQITRSVIGPVAIYALSAIPAALYSPPVVSLEVCPR